MDFNLKPIILLNEKSFQPICILGHCDLAHPSSLVLLAHLALSPVICILRDQSCSGRSKLDGINCPSRDVNPIFQVRTCGVAPLKSFGFANLIEKGTSVGRHLETGLGRRGDAARFLNELSN